MLFGWDIYPVNHVSGAMIFMLASSEVNRVFEPQSGQTKD
jgi:hypothetical protein